MTMKNKFYIILLFALVTACSIKENAGEENAKIAFLSFPSNVNSGEPFLFTDKDSTVYLSWIEKNET